MNHNELSISSSSDGDDLRSQSSTSVVVHASDNLQNVYLTKTLAEQLRVAVTLQTYSGAPDTSPVPVDGYLHLIDATGWTTEHILTSIAEFHSASSEKGVGDSRLAFFNVARESDEALMAEYQGWSCLRALFLDNTSVADLSKGLAAIVHGQYWLSRAYTDQLIRRCSVLIRPATRHLPLTPKEREILDLIVVGRSNDQIATEQGVSPHTVKAHIYRIYKKLGVKNRVQAANCVTGAADPHI